MFTVAMLHVEAVRSLQAYISHLPKPIVRTTLVTVSGGKGSMFETPRGYNLVAELDMYHPLPDYMYHATSLRLGEIAMYPNEKTTTRKPASPPSAPHHDHELSEQELNEYLKDHPEAWIPTSWSKDRIDNSASKIPLSTSSNRMPYLQKSPPITYQSWKRKLWESTGNDRLYYSNLPPKRVRSVSDFEAQDNASSLWMEPTNHLNISHHLGWEHYHHYRDRRSLFHQLETTVPNFIQIDEVKFVPKNCPECKRWMVVKASAVNQSAYPSYPFVAIPQLSDKNSFEQGRRYDRGSERLNLFGRIRYDANGVLTGKGKEKSTTIMHTSIPRANRHRRGHVRA
uniref:Uncharacterized protein n=1 Tax=Anopheles culicifacies TaxID=139723 RepID=A0A182M5H0_9DIPT